MGGRQSVQRAADGLSETSKPFRPRSNFNSRVCDTVSSKYHIQPLANIPLQKLTAPLAAFTMAAILFVYARTSIHAARLNAQKHRETDGGQLNWRNESLRRHGQLDRIDERSLLKEALVGDRRGPANKVEPQMPRGKNEPATALEDFKRERRSRDE
jgi:hypothetical protein